tara:strand:+ start:4798 stop:9657 length:4860 start_codon:yes stop_codon:yes gene_type:complete
MKHYEIKTQIAGAFGGKKRKPKPATLTPPKLGDYEVSSSYGYSEILDLISDGPIEGLCNKNGYTLPSSAILQGVYLNNVAVEETNQKFLPDYGKEVKLDDQSSFANQFSQIFKDISSIKMTDLEIGSIGYPDTSNLFEVNDLYYQYNIVRKYWESNGVVLFQPLYDGSANNNINDIGRFTNLTKRPSNYSNVITNNETSIQKALLSNSKYEVNFCMGIIESADLLNKKTNFRKGLDSFLDVFYNGNLYMKQYAKGILLQNGFDQSRIYDNSINIGDIRSFFESKYYKELPSWFLNPENKIPPFTCITIEGTMEGFEFYKHTNFFLKRDSDGKTTSELNYLAGFGLDSSVSYSGLKIADNATSMFVPVLASDGTWKGKVKGFYFFSLDVEPYVYLNVEGNYPPEYEQEYINSNPSAQLASPNETDVLVLAQNQYEVEFLKNFKGFSLFDRYDTPYKPNSGTGTFFDIANGALAKTDYNVYYEVYDFELQVVDNGGCNLSTNEKRILRKSGFIKGKEVQEISHTSEPLFTNGNVIRKGWQVKYTFKAAATRTPIGAKIYFQKQYNGDESRNGARKFSRANVKITADTKLLYSRQSDGFFRGVNETNWSEFGWNDEPEFTIPASEKVQTIVLDIVEFYETYVPVNCPFTVDPNLASSSIRVETPFGLFREIVDQSADADGEIDDFNKKDKDEFNAVKYNWSNVLTEFRRGSQKQSSLDYFQDIHVDYSYNYTLLGPFTTSRNLVQRVIQSSGKNEYLKKDGIWPRLTFSSRSLPEMDEEYLYSIREGSRDDRGTRKGTQKFADWDKNDQDFDEKAQALTHTILSPNVDCVWFTLAIDKLTDTVEQSLGDPEDPALAAGTTIPSVVNIRVEVGYISETGKTQTTTNKFFQIAAMIESTSLVDIGNPYNLEAADSYSYIQEIQDIAENETGLQHCAPGFFDVIDGKGGLFECFVLPPAKKLGESNLNTANQEESSLKRFIRITKMSTETNSTLIFKNIGVYKITEVTKGNLRYPFTAYAGIKLDSRVFSDIPQRAYEAKLKKVKIPTNYYPTYGDGKDKRYYNSAGEYLTTDIENLQIYKGDWDGSFKFAWTDNPAWILYDMITNPRYGLGSFIKESEVNKWDLYKIGKFCDSVDDKGYFDGLPDGRGGIEPRFACNIMFSQETKIFDAINTIANMFRGVVYYNNKTIEFSDDRPKEPVCIFTNANVKQGIFTYSNFKRDEQINTVEVSYIDRFNEWKNKLEIVENRNDIAKRGIFKKTVNAFGVTSKSMARRHGEHILSETTEDNQNVSFICGLEGLLCKPGDLILVEDDLKSFKSNFGKVLNTDENKKSIRISNKFNNVDYVSEITLFKPSEITDVETITETSSSIRSRLQEFTITNSSGDFLNGVSGWDYMAGPWNFDSYTSGYNVFDSNNNYIPPLQQDYAVYTRKDDLYPNQSDRSTIWFNTEARGWVFSTGDYSASGNLENNNLFILEPEIFSFLDLQLFDVNNLDVTAIKYYDVNSPDKRGSFITNFTGRFYYENPLTDLVYTYGNESLTSKIGSNVQIFRVPVTGWAGSDYGDEVYIDKNHYNASLLKFVPEGTTYRFQLKNKSESVFKITSMKEEVDNEFNIVAKQYNTGKYKDL